jgi:hypothetical protein
MLIDMLFSPQLWGTSPRVSLISSKPMAARKVSQLSWNWCIEVGIGILASLFNGRLSIALRTSCTPADYTVFLPQQGNPTFIATVETSHSLPYKPNATPQGNLATCRCTPPGSMASPVSGLPSSQPNLRLPLRFLLMHCFGPWTGERNLALQSN